MEVEKIHLKSVDSTMDFAKKNANSFDPNKLTIIFSDEQTKGRGRFQRSWLSPKGENIYASFYIQFEKNFEHLSSLAQFMTFILAKVLIHEDLFPKIRWPNDLLICDKKVSGVLCETVIRDGMLDIVIGFGLNVDTPKDILERIDKPSISLMQAKTKNWKKEDLLQNIEKMFLEHFPNFVKDGFSYCYEEFNELLAYKGKLITCTDGKNRWEGVCHSITKDGRLNLSLPDGNMKTLSAADISTLVS